MRQVRTEWTKFRTVPGWVAATIAAALATVLVALFAGGSGSASPAPPVGPDGQPVADSFYFVRKQLTGDGSVTVPVTSLTSAAHDGPTDVPWAKAGLIIKQNTEPGSPYVAIMVTGGHGVRMQHGFTGDIAGPVPSARWLRLERSGDTVTGLASTDGTDWRPVGTATVSGPTVQGGLFVASPPQVRGMGTVGTVSAAAFGGVRADGEWDGRGWTSEQIGAESPTFAGYPDGSTGSVKGSIATEPEPEAEPGPRTGTGTGTGTGSTVVTGAGDIAVAVRETLATGGILSNILTGTFVALIILAVVGALFVTTEHRDGLILATIAAEPRRLRVLGAKAIVLVVVCLAVGLIGTFLAARLGMRLARANGVFIIPVTPAQELRVVVGTAVMLAAVAVLALAVGTIGRSGAGAVTTVVVAIVLPYLLVANPFTPAVVADWLARTTPAAAFAIQQTIAPQHQVDSIYTPYVGYFPLSPWAGLLVLVGWTLVALAVAAVVSHRRDT
ncbi:ABC transporter permease subunit [Actinoplanes couchii]|uniref:Uncharacterized protein n=1 Tax=Actinoplanes couchii TaxID=403638 RepID=A0ABQ3XQW0_9ACTN|nr:ABC transporter permease subunit [Actinoplanes couchii]MDR6317492.1 ABC-type transport system involved in multi-copper enzyme maturation permease subunit [Actinoplanes couchii]GID60795.1 hypothetical protein Aco03nite_091990 [Actinoplanes couchii]